MPQKPATMRDVANKAGVSIQTVSAVVNGKDGISQQTRNRVLDVVKQLNYKRDPIARSMRTGQTGLVGLLIQDITNPILSKIASQVDALVSAEDHNVVLCNASSEPDRERAYLELVENRLIDGLIVVNAVDQAHTLAVLEKTATPAVFIDSLTRPSVPSVSTDDVRGAYLATQYLIEQGHQRIAHISGATALEITQRRIRGYTQALSDYGLTFHRVVSPESTRWDYKAGYEAMRQILAEDQVVTAVFAAGDEMALGAYRALFECGLSIPGDVAIVGFDDIEAAAYATPSLTTIRQPFAEMASRAVSLLFQIIRGQPSEPVQIMLDPELILRESTAANS
ncbi:MAG TPA: LacI family DNA-binding transcriptional regulator [Spirillospora sp.]|nr:LacI family DNA-binding transcriptional regulator [Spirillospora sp.]